MLALIPLLTLLSILSSIPKHTWVNCTTPAEENWEVPLIWGATKGFLDVVKLSVANGAQLKNTDDTAKTPLHLAAENGHLSVVNYLEKMGADVNATDKDGKTPLHLAVQNGHVNVVDSLVTNMADVNSMDNEGYTPLQLAASNGYLEIVQYLVDHRASLNATNNYGTALHLAAINEHDDVLKYLLMADNTSNLEPPPLTVSIALKKKHINGLAYLLEWGVKLTGDNGWHSLILAASKGRVDIVKVLVEKGVDVDDVVTYKRTKTPLLEAVKHGYSVVVEYLLSKGANANFYGQRSLVYEAASRGYLNVTKSLIKWGGDVDAKYINGETPLQGAIRKMRYLKGDNSTSLCDYDNCTHLRDHPDFRGVAKYLVDLGGDVNRVIGDTGKSLIVEFVQFGDLNTTMFLVDIGAQVNVKDIDGRAPLHHATLNMDLEMTKYLIEEGADVNSQDYANRTPLAIAVTSRRSSALNLVKLLVEAGADVNAKDYWGRTPLHNANDVDIVKFLVGMGADINSTSFEGKTPLLTHNLEGDLGIVKYLVEEGADVNHKDNYGSSALHRQYHPDIVTYLVDKGADVNAIDNKGRTPMHYAAEYFLADFTVFAFLLSRGSDINKRDFLGSSPLHEAVHNLNYHVAVFLVDNGADVNAIDDEGNTPLHIAVNVNTLDAVTFLAEHGANKDIKNSKNETPLHLAAAKGYLEVVTYFVNLEKDINPKIEDDFEDLTLA